MPAEHVVELCRSAPSIAAELAKDPSQSVDHLLKRLRKEWKAKQKQSKHVEKGSKEREARERLDSAAACGKFPNRPSDLFLEVYADVLDTISTDPLANLVSPSLIGSSGTIPLSVVSVIPDIMRHYADLIANAQHEIFLATNYWENSSSAALISEALRSLSKRGLEEGRKEEEKVVVKVVYDRGTPSQIIQNHSSVAPSKWDDVGLPRPEDLTGLRMEVLNYHRPPLGTFHAKYLIVDRRVACLNSNNIQDRPNVEMCVHLEGPIVESFYDVALYSWANKFDPPLPLLSRPPSGTYDYKFGDENEHLKYIDTEFAGKAARELLGKQHERQAQEAESGKGGKQEAQDGHVVGRAVRTAAGIQRAGTGMQGKDDLIAEHPAMTLPDDVGRKAKGSGSGSADNDIEERQERARRDGVDVDNNEDTRKGDSAELEDRQNRPQVPSSPQAHANGSDDHQVPASSDSSTGPEILKSEEDVNGTKSRPVDAITKHLNAATLHEKGTAGDDVELDDFCPHIMHSPHAPVPIAMVNRAPRGTPGHEGIDDVPQNVAWLSLIKHAKETIFIQSPTFNASPVIPAVTDACRRGVQVTLYLDLGFNDLGELIPFQGGTNEQVVHSMYDTLNKEGKQGNLKVYWYTAKDQIEPMSATRKSRNCHVKFMSVDSQVVMLGNGNQDTQSWFHSQETNVLIDSAQLAAEWHQGLNANQNTARFGLVDEKDGVWRARDGSKRVVQSSGTKTGGIFSGLKGISGAIKRVRGTGGF